LIHSNGITQKIARSSTLDALAPMIELGPTRPIGQQRPHRAAQQADEQRVPAEIISITGSQPPM
jgi:hypothetical protein